jgi:hypothetical protein
LISQADGPQRTRENDLVSSSVQKNLCRQQLSFFNATETMKLRSGSNPKRIYLNYDMHFWLRGIGGIFRRGRNVYGLGFDQAETAGRAVPGFRAVVNSQDRESALGLAVQATRLGHGRRDDRMALLFTAMA